MAIRIMTHTTDYFIVGPALQPDNGVLEAIYSLFYLPQNYKLILPAPTQSGRFFQEVVDVVKENDLEQRVYFSNQEGSNDSAEGFASAVLNTARSGYSM